MLDTYVCHCIWDSITILQEQFEYIKGVIIKWKTKTDGQYNLTKRQMKAMLLKMIYTKLKSDQQTPQKTGHM